MCIYYLIISSLFIILCSVALKLIQSFTSVFDSRSWLSEHRVDSLLFKRGFGESDCPRFGGRARHGSVRLSSVHFVSVTCVVRTGDFSVVYPEWTRCLFRRWWWNKADKCAAVVRDAVCVERVSEPEVNVTYWSVFALEKSTNNHTQTRLNVFIYTCNECKSWIVLICVVSWE